MSACLGGHHAAFAVGSGTISSRVTSPPVKSRTIFIKSSGTPLDFHCEIADADRPQCAASAFERPSWASSQSASVMAASLPLAKPSRQASSKRCLFSISLMDHNHRRARFKAWYARTYGDAPDSRARFMADTGRHGYEPITKGRVSQLFDEAQPFGEAAARQLAARLGLADDAFLRDLSELAYKAGLMLDDVPDEQQRKQVYAYWALIQQLVMSGQQVNIMSAPGAASPADTVPTRQRRAGT